MGYGDVTVAEHRYLGKCKTCKAKCARMVRERSLEGEKTDYYGNKRQNVYACCFAGVGV